MCAAGIEAAPCVLAPGRELVAVASVGVCALDDAAVFAVSFSSLIKTVPLSVSVSLASTLLCNDAKQKVNAKSSLAFALNIRMPPVFTCIL
jgi:hypothetical protein